MNAFPLLQAHRGVSTECPENTIAAFYAAILQGYEYIELDPAVTKDGKIVVLHDKTLNRTARFSDGSPISDPLPLESLTYDEAAFYDVGIGFSQKFRGERIPLLSEVLDLCKGRIKIKIDNKIQKFEEKSLADLFFLLRESGREYAVTTSRVDFARRVLMEIPGCEIHYDGVVNEKVLKDLSALAGENLYVWLPLGNRLTSWCSLPPADAESAALVHRYAKLGLWLGDSEEDLSRAISLGADILETTGRIKPKRTSPLVDMHVHTAYSHDAKAELPDLIREAEEKGVRFAATDHFDTEYAKGSDLVTPILLSVAAARSKGVLAGVEVGEAIVDREISSRLISMCDYDVVIGSVHAVRGDGETVPYSLIDFGSYSDEMIKDFLKRYFDDVLETVRTVDFDILPHLTCPLRYLVGKYGFRVDLSPYMPVIRLILSETIMRGIVLEVNTSTTDGAYAETMPDREILALYHELGGMMLSLGSDAHISENLAKNFDDTCKMLKEIGFKHLYYVERRQPIPYDIP